MNESIFDELYIPERTCSIDPEFLDSQACDICVTRSCIGMPCHQCILALDNEPKLIEYLEVFS